MMKAMDTMKLMMTMNETKGKSTNEDKGPRLPLSRPPSRTRSRSEGELGKVVVRMMKDIVNGKHKRTTGTEATAVASSAPTTTPKSAVAAAAKTTTAAAKTTTTTTTERTEKVSSGRAKNAKNHAKSKKKILPTLPLKTTKTTPTTVAAEVMPRAASRTGQTKKQGVPNGDKNSSPTHGKEENKRNNNRSNNDSDADDRHTKHPHRSTRLFSWLTIPEGCPIDFDFGRKKNKNNTNNNNNNKRRISSMEEEDRDSEKGNHHNHNNNQNHTSNDDNNNNRENLFVLPKWKILCISGLFLMALSIMAFVGHAKLNRDRNNNANTRDNIFGTAATTYDDDIFLQGAAENVYEKSPCGPRSWPSLLGVLINEARQQILQENRCVVVQIIVLDGSSPSSSSSSTNVPYDPERVRLYMDRDAGTVARIPRVG